MQVVLKLIPFDKSSELSKELNKELIESTHLIKDKLGLFNEQNSVDKKELVEYFLITNNNGYCHVMLYDKDLPEWLINFLLMSFDKVQSRFS